MLLFSFINGQAVQPLPHFFIFIFLSLILHKVSRNGISVIGSHKHLSSVGSVYLVVWLIVSFMEGCSELISTKSAYNCLEVPFHMMK